MLPIRQLFKIFLVVLFVSSTGGYARWATPEDASIQFDSYNRELTIQADGSSEELVDLQVTILNEEGRNAFGVQRLHYNSNIQEVKILEAKTIYENKEYLVPAEMIETKPLASEIQGFDQLFQILIAFPQVAPGSKIVLKYKIHTVKQPLLNYFATDFYYGREGVWKKSSIKIKSALPLHTLSNDPNKVLDFKEGRDKGLQTINITLKKPIYQSLINEPSAVIMPEEIKTWVSISTHEKFEDLGRGFVDNFEKVISQPLPSALLSVKESAQKLSDSIEQINHVTAALADKIRYMGDWRSIEGRFSPRSFQTIVESGVGDCKDFSSMTVAILRGLGFQADVALVTRKMPYLTPKKQLPSVDSVNHAIVKVALKDGRVLWVDPTNPTSMAQGVFPDIADRPAIVLNAKAPSYDYIPAIDPHHAQFENESEMELKNDTILSTKGKLILKGEQSLLLSGATLSNSPQAVEEMLTYHLSGEVTPVHKKINLPDLKSRIVKDIMIDYAYDQENSILFTNKGDGILLDTGWIESYLDTSRDQVGTLYLGYPMILKRKITIPHVQVENLAQLNYEFKTPWLEAKRECREIEGRIEIEEQFFRTQSFIGAQEIKSSAYQDLKKNLKKYCHKVALIVSRK
jgi:hypothetical protein